MRRHVTRSVLGLALLAATVTSGSSQAAMLVSTEVGNGADTSLQNDSQSGGTSAVVAGGFGNVPFRRSDDSRQKMLLVRFDISTLDNSSFADAVLRFNYNHNRVRTMRVYALADAFDNWDEATTSYSNAPGILQPDQGGSAYNSGGNNFLDATELFFPGAPTPQRPNPYQIGTIQLADTRGLTGGRGVVISNPANLDLEPLLTADTNGLVTFLLFHDGSDTAQTGDIATKEHPTFLPPMLGVLPPGFVPEPTTALLAALGMIGFAAPRR